MLLVTAAWISEDGRVRSRRPTFDWSFLRIRRPAVPVAEASAREAGERMKDDETLSGQRRLFATSQVHLYF